MPFLLGFREKKFKGREGGISADANALRTGGQSCCVCTHFLILKVIGISSKVFTFNQFYIIVEYKHTRTFVCM